MRRKSFTLVELMAVIVISSLISFVLFTMFMVVRGTYTRDSALIDLQQQARLGMNKMINELQESASAQIDIRECPAGVCLGGAIRFRVPVATDSLIVGSIYKIENNILAIKWGYDNNESDEANAEATITFFVPAEGSSFDRYHNQLIRITPMYACNNGVCEPGENSGNCPQDCPPVCGNTICEPPIENSSNCSQDCVTNFCGDGVCNAGETAASCSLDCGGGPRTCFLAKTPITMADGSLKPIEKIKVGEMVLSFNTDSKTFVKEKVNKILRHKDTKYLVINNHLKVTALHRFYSQGKWVEIGKLKVGDKLFNSQGEEEEIFDIQEVKKKVTVYNFEVNTTHTYFAAGYLVHNRKGGPPIESGGLWNYFLSSTAFAQGGIGLPDISAYEPLPNLAHPSSYNIKVLANDVEGVYFIGNNAYPATPDIVRIYLFMSKKIFGQEEINFSLPSEVRLRNLSM